MHSFTQEDLIQYMYGETSHEKTTAIKDALTNDWELREAYEVLASAQKSLEKVSLSPRKKALDFIISYAGNPVKEVLNLES
jgi:hypothetical protein